MRVQEPDKDRERHTRGTDGTRKKGDETVPRRAPAPESSELVDDVEVVEKQ